MGRPAVALSDPETGPAQLVRLRHGGAHIWYDASLFDPFRPGIFDPAWLQDQGLITGRSTGRNTAFFFRDQGHDLVLRHYWRGGMIARLNRDSFLRVPVAGSRAMQEFALLDWMRGRGLPVPRPCAARFRPVAGLLYQADLVTQMLPGTRTLADRLAEGRLDPAIWSRIGRSVAQLHQHGVCHADLNCRNILLDEAQKPWLIDFDKSARRPDGPWKQANIDRLQRSLQKESRLNPAVHWDAQGWAALLGAWSDAAS